MAKRFDTLLVIPTYNEAANIPQLLRQIGTQALPLDLLIIDDNSPDGTAQLAETFSNEFPLKVIRRSGKLGVGSAHKEGFRYAIQNNYAAVMTMDADFAHSPEYLREMLSKGSTSDVVVGSRYLKGGGLPGWSLPRRLLTYAAHRLTVHLLGIPYDCTGGFRHYRTSLLRQIHFDGVQSEGNAFLIELIFQISRRGFSISQIPIVINSRRLGESKISRTEILRALKTVCRLCLGRMAGNRS